MSDTNRMGALNDPSAPWPGANPNPGQRSALEIPSLPCRGTITTFVEFNTPAGASQHKAIAAVNRGAILTNATIDQYSATASQPCGFFLKLGNRPPSAEADFLALDTLWPQYHTSVVHHDWPAFSCVRVLKSWNLEVHIPPGYSHIIAGIHAQAGADWYGIVSVTVQPPPTE